MARSSTAQAAGAAAVATTAAVVDNKPVTKARRPQLLVVGPAAAALKAVPAGLGGEAASGKEATAGVHAAATAATTRRCGNGLIIDIFVYCLLAWLSVVWWGSLRSNQSSSVARCRLPNKSRSVPKTSSRSALPSLSCFMSSSATTRPAIITTHHLFSSSRLCVEIFLRETL